jgi:dihydrofolate reductase
LHGDEQSLSRLVDRNLPAHGMAKLTVFVHLTLDGVMQSPGLPDEDTRGGFKYGGWAQPYSDPVMNEVIRAGMKQNLELLLGRFTYESFHSYWPHQKDNPFTEVLNRTRKYVVSRTAREPLAWQNSALLEGEGGQTVAQLKRRSGADLLVMGSGELVRTLIGRNLIDEYLLTIHPLVLGQGKRLFSENGAFAKLKLVGSRISTTGVMIGTYRPE